MSISECLKQLRKLISNQCEATKETAAIVAAVVLTVVAVVLKILFSVNACNLDFSSYQKEQTLLEMNDISNISRAYQGVQTKSKVWQ